MSRVVFRQYKASLDTIIKAGFGPMDYRISLIISHTFLHETSHPKNGVRLTIEMQLTSRIICKINSQTCICIRSIYE